MRGNPTQQLPHSEQRCRLSIITPTLNSIATIRKCIQSVADQSFEDIEHIIIDGGSKDGTAELVQEISRVSYIRQDGLGIFNAMNQGVGTASGHWIYFLGSDDYLADSTVLSDLHQYFESDLDVFYGDIFDNHRQLVYDGPFDEKKIRSYNLCHQAVFINRNVFDRIGLFDPAYDSFSDWDHNMRWMLDRDIKKRYVDRVIAVYGGCGHSHHNPDRIFERDRLHKYLQYGKKHLSAADFISTWCRELLKSVLAADLSRIRRNFSTSFGLEPALNRLKAETKGRADHVFLVPWLKKGGADLETLNYVHLLASHKQDLRILVLGTEDSESPWAEKLPKEALFVEFGKITTGLTFKLKRRALESYLTEIRPRVIHVINSNAGYECIREFGKKLQTFAALFVSVFCEDYTRTGAMCGYPIRSLPRISKNLDGVFSDNRRILELVSRHSALKQNQLHTHYQPLNHKLPIRPTFTPNKKTRLQVVWAGRLDRQKRPDLLLKVAKECADISVDFHVYGEVVIDRAKNLKQLKNSSNITFHGGFDGFEEIPYSRYDVLLSTSQWEGLPNIFIEALAVELPVISSDVGGVSELISHSVTGVLVSPYDNITAYRRAIKWALDNPKLLRALGVRGKQLVEKRHSWAQFRRSVGAIDGYLPN